MPANENDEMLLRTQEDVRIRNTFQFIMEIPFVIFLFLFTFALTGTVTYNLLLYRTCLNDLHYNASKCDLLHSVNKTGEAKALETVVEAETTLLVMALSMVSGIVPAILAAFLGAWSDKCGRKPLVVSPILGQLISGILMVVYCALPKLSSWWFIVCALPFTVFGGSTTLSLGCNLSITDKTDDTNRSLRLSILQGSGFLGVLIGTVLSSYVYQAVGYLPTFTIAVSLYLVCLLYTLVCIRESLADPIGINLKDLFDFGLLKEMSTVCFKKRPKNIATILFLLISSYAITMFCIYGVANIDYLFTRQKFQWLLKDYTIFSSVNTIIIVFGMFFGMAFFQSLCKMSDGILLILAYVSSITQAVVRCLSEKPWQMYLAGAMSMLGGLSPPLIQSQVAKVVPKEEVARMYSLIACVEAFAPVLSPLLFNTIYVQTLSTFPGAIYAVTATLLLVCLVFVAIAEVIFYRKSRDQNNYSRMEDCPTSV